MRRPVLGVEEADLEDTVNWSEPRSLNKKYPCLRVPPLYESEYVFWRVHGECAGPERSDGRINHPLLDPLPTRGGTGYTNERNRTSRTPCEEIPAYRNQLPPAKVPQSQDVTAFLDGMKILPNIHIFLDLLSPLL